MERSFAAPARPWAPLAALAALAALAGCDKVAPSSPHPAPRSPSPPMTPTTIPNTPTFIAQTESSRQVNIVARVSGFLETIAYQEGELVKQGELMFTLDTKPFPRNSTRRSGELQSQQARLDDRPVDLRPCEAVGRAGGAAAGGTRQGQGRARRRRGGGVRRAARVEQAQLNLGYATIPSPVTGLASRALQRQGAYVNATAESAKLTYVAAIEPIWVNFSVSQNQMAKWQEWRKGEIIPPPERQLRRRRRAAGRTSTRTGKDRLHRPVIHPGHRNVHRARGAAEPKGSCVRGCS